MKTCTKCGENKPKNEFYNRASSRDGICMQCFKARRAVWRNSKREHIKAYQDSWDKANPSSRKPNSAVRAAYYVANKDRMNAYNVDRRAANPEISRIENHNKRARKRQNGGKLSPGLSAKLIKLQRGKCACCGLPLGDDYHLDHILPIALGGANEDWNIQLLRSMCNLKKHAKHPIDYMQSKGMLL